MVIQSIFRRRGESRLKKRILLKQLIWRQRFRRRWTMADEAS